MLPRISLFVKENQRELVLLTGVLLISSLSFAFGYIIAKTEEKDYLEFEEPIIYEKDEQSGAYRDNS